MNQQETKDRNKTLWLGRFRANVTLRQFDPTEGPYFSGRAPFLLLFALALIGLFATGFLTYRHVLLASHAGSVGDSLLCRAQGKINCDAILLTEYSDILGIVSSAVLGLMGFVFVTWCLANAIFNQRVRKLAWVLLVLYFSAAIGFSWYYVYLMVFEVDFVCTWCIGVHVVNLLSLIIVIVVSIKKRNEFLVQEIASLGERIYFAVGGVLAAVAVFLAAGMWEQSLSFQDAKMKFEDMANDPVVIMAMLTASPTFDIPISPQDPTYGSPSAPYPIVFFSDFQCPVCARSEVFLRQLVDLNPGLLKVVYKNFPLSVECNQRILTDLHPAACPAARAAYAAFMLGGAQAFWKYGDLIFENQKKLNPNSWVKFADKIGLDQEKFLHLNRPSSPADVKLKEDVYLGNSLNLQATPQMFFGGKKLPAGLKAVYVVDTLEQLIRSSDPNAKDLRLKRP
ncbi:MAG: thioredoxin domain-containing protein [Desulfomonile tiedjei]|nr:thioredoxin domain-containing protein [Desulfomonile tiedjei]